MSSAARVLGGAHVAFAVQAVAHDHVVAAGAQPRHRVLEPRPQDGGHAAGRRGDADPVAGTQRRGQEDGHLLILARRVARVAGHGRSVRTASPLASGWSALSQRPPGRSARYPEDAPQWRSTAAATGSAPAARAPRARSPPTSCRQVVGERHRLDAGGSAVALISGLQRGLVREDGTSRSPVRHDHLPRTSTATGPAGRSR